MSGERIINSDILRPQDNPQEDSKKDPPIMPIHGDYYFTEGTCEIRPQLLEKIEQIKRGNY